MDCFIETADALQACIGKPPGPRDAKLIDHIDEGAALWLAHSPVLFMALEGRHGMEITLAGGAAGFVKVADPLHLRLSKAALDHPDLVAEGQGFGCLCAVPGLGETLRINGQVAGTQGDGIVLRVHECYMHCAKALIRSEFWKAGPAMDPPVSAPEPTREGGSAGPLGSARFLALATSDGCGHADLSPKGDPAGLLLRMHEGLPCFADRPGNRRTDSFLNILANPRVALAALVPGSLLLYCLRGTARLSHDEALRRAFVVNGKLPAVVVQLTGAQALLQRSPALARASLWPAAPAPDGLVPSRLMAAHVLAHRGRSAGDLLAKALVSVPGLMRKGLEHDYRKNLY